MTDYEEVDKHWAKRYILDPLTAPEPSQETGPGSSHYNVHLRATRPISIASRPTPHPKTALPASPPSPPQQYRRSASFFSSKNQSPSASSDQVQDPFADSCASANFFNNPTPPDNAAGFHKPPPGQYHPSNPYARRARRTSNLGTHHEEATAASSRDNNNTGLVSPPQSPGSPVSDTAPAQPYSLSPTAAYHSGRLPIRSASARVPGGPRPEQQQQPPPQQHTRSRSDGHHHHHHHRPPSTNRSSGLYQRYPGDMTHRPLDMIKRETRAADRRHRKRFSEADTIDLLDTIGPTYHHGGPYDATLASRNMNKMYSPVEAVRDSNMAALRATPREFVVDSLTHHRPLVGTASIPSGGLDASGHRMEYEEGADLMREPDAAGGAYKRYPFIQYHPDDLKGKGEPSFTVERDLKGHKAKGPADGTESFEMEANPLMAKSLRRKSVPVGFSSGAQHTGGGAVDDGDENQGLGRQNSTGRRISDGLKRRFGSLRRKKSPSPDMD